MASGITHAITALCIGKTVLGDGRETGSDKPLFAPVHWLILMLCSLIPDADVVAFDLGIPYHHPLGHRGFTHSLLFAAGLAWVLWALMFRRLGFFTKDGLRVFMAFFLTTASHGLFDAMTNGGVGIAFFAPFDNTRYFLPWRMIEVSPISIGRFFSSRGVAILISEAKFVWLPCAVIVLLSLLLRRMRRAQNG